ncbi:caspase family protein [Streptomyces sp. NPDC048172]|uniref:HD domain-containing protein n=1 Tax=Streptomyces sp. NPDC048172 TaxID=3365505 RepID=UPI003716348A
MTTDTPAAAPARRALLIGVGEVPGATETFPSLREAVRADLRLLGEALEGSGYEVERCAGEDSTRTGILTRLDEAARAVPPGGTFVVAFTGHGIRLGGTDYLVPADARAPADGHWSLAYTQGLIPADIAPHLTESGAATVLWAVDACRDAAAEEAGAAFATRVGVRPGLKLAVLVGCSPGERCGATAEGSFFSRALAGALHPYASPQTLEQVYEHVRAHAPRLALRAGHTAQRPLVDYGTDAGRETSATEVCQGRRLAEEWSTATREPALWEAARDAEPERVAHLQSCLATLAERCAAVVHKAHARRDDPWADADFPVRLLRRCLPRLLPEGTPLTVAEVAALIAAPFLHEAAWADQLSRSVELNVLDAGQCKDAGPVRRHWEHVRDQHTQVARKLRGLAGDPERREDAEAVALWLAHRWIADRMGPGDATVPAGVAEGFAAELAGDTNADRLSEQADALRWLARAVSPEGLEEEAPVRRTGGMRLRPLAGLLHLAAVLAADARTLPEVIADHLAVADPVRPSDAVDAMRGALSWDTDGAGGELYLDMPCPHPAVHAAMQEVVAEADEVAALLRGWATERLPAGEAELLAAIPTRVTDRDLRPGAAGTAYDVPLLRFQLSQTEVRDLLMGRELYGDPALAFRELFQNAMDACRYRAMRGRYLSLRGGPVPAPWEGRISIVQGEDARGRYVECRDNGVGMGREQLESTFTQAGRRFVHSRAFRREQTEWLRVDPSLQLHPNSRFGIGVLSYFMLADEMTLVTRQVDVDGRPVRDALRVDIASSGSLFRIRRQEEGAGEDACPEGGTRVRLYLRGDEDLAGLSCAETLRELVAVSEFALEADDGRRREEWEPGRLYLGARNPLRNALSAVEGTLWWVPDEGAVLCDGVMTDARPYGYVLNLTADHAGELSVDRKRLQSYDEKWAAETLRTGAECLPDWPELTLEWLWSMEKKSLPALRTVWDTLRGRGLTVRFRPRRETTIPLDSAGCFASDQGVERPRFQASFRDTHAVTEPWRARALGLRESRAFPYAPASLEGLPLAGPGDSTVADHPTSDWRAAALSFDKAGLTLGEGLIHMRRLRAMSPHFAPPPLSSSLARQHLGNQERELLRALCTSRPQEVHPDFDVHVVDTSRDNFTGVIFASQRSGRTVGDLVRTVSTFSSFLTSPLPPVPPELSGHVCSLDDVQALGTLSFALDQGYRIALDPTRRTPARAALIRWLRPGAPDPFAETPETVDVFGAVADKELRASLRSHLDWSATTGPRLAPLAAVSFAAEREISLSEAETELAAQCAESSVHFTRVSEESGLREDWVPSPQAASLLARLRRSGRREISLSDVSTFGPDDPTETLGELAAAGAPLAPLWPLLEKWDELPQRTRRVLSLASRQGPADRLTTLSLFSAACDLQEPLSDVWDVALGALPDRASLVPPLPETVRHYSVARADGECLTNLPPSESGAYGYLQVFLHQTRELTNRRNGVPSYRDEGKAPEWAPLTAARLVRYAHERGLSPADAYAHLAPLRALGAQIPELTDEELATFPGTVPDGLTVIALADTHRVSAPGEPFCALDLVSIAARLGEPVSAAWRRMEPYACLGVRTDVAHIPDVLPLWQDLALLSTHLDGMLPAVTGRVTDAHIAFAAEGVEETADWVRERLTAYAAMFELEVNDDGA